MREQRARADQSEDVDMVNAVTAIVREVDAAFAKAGGTSRHWVRDWFLPTLNAKGWQVVPLSPPGQETAARRVEQTLAFIAAEFRRTGRVQDDSELTEAELRHRFFRWMAQIEELPWREVACFNCSGSGGTVQSHDDGSETYDDCATCRGSGRIEIRADTVVRRVGTQETAAPERPPDTYRSGEPMPQYATLGIGVEAWVELTQQEQPRRDGRRLSDSVIISRRTFDVVMRVLRAVRVADFKSTAPDYSPAEQACRGCMGPCGRCEELGTPDLRAQVEALRVALTNESARLLSESNHVRRVANALPARSQKRGATHATADYLLDAHHRMAGITALLSAPGKETR